MNDPMIPIMAKLNIEFEAILGGPIRDPLDVHEARPAAKFEVRIPAMVFRAWFVHFADHCLGSQCITDILDHRIGRHVLPLLPKVTGEYRFRGEFNVVIVGQNTSPVEFAKDCSHTFSA